MDEKTPTPPADAGPVDCPVGRLEPERQNLRGPMPVRCEICQWRGRRLKPRSAPCPACGSRVEYA